MSSTSSEVTCLEPVASIPSQAVVSPSPEVIRFSPAVPGNSPLSVSTDITPPVTGVALIAVSAATTIVPAGTSLTEKNPWDLVPDQPKLKNHSRFAC